MIYSILTGNTHTHTHTHQHSWTHLCSLAMRCSSLSSLPLKPFAKGLFSIFSCVIWAPSREHLYLRQQALLHMHKHTFMRLHTDTQGPIQLWSCPFHWLSTLSERPCRWRSSQHSSAADGSRGADTVLASWPRINCLPKQSPGLRTSGQSF